MGARMPSIMRAGDASMRAPAITPRKRTPAAYYRQRFLTEFSVVTATFMASRDAHGRASKMSCRLARQFYRCLSFMPCMLRRLRFTQYFAMLMIT